MSRGLVPSREIAQSLIVRGDVLVNDTPVTKPGTRVGEDVAVRLRSELPRFVSRGGEKLDGALEEFDISVQGKVALDLGASTGGFTDCLLQRGASLVYAVDVGTNQLAHQLRQDPRVRVFEELHARDLSAIPFDPRPTFATVDVSFISVRKVLPFLLDVLARPGELVVLVKPQFELTPQHVDKGGVVRSDEARKLAVKLVRDWAVEHALEVRGEATSVLRGAKAGNEEYFVYLFDSRAR